MRPLHFSYETYNNKMQIPSLIVLVVLITLVSPTSSCTEKEKSSLLRFLVGLSQDGGLTVSWRNITDCCKWEGITCSSDATVTGVSLASKGLEGNISLSLGNLTGLKLLNLSHNSLFGGLPLELLSSSSINIIDISFNQLNGALHELPSSTPGRPLQVLNISSNLFTGLFPSTTWKAMENLVALNASNNSFTGPIPTDFCDSSPSFAALDLSFNKFSGSIPAGIGDCSMLSVLNAGHNNLSGTIPDELFNLKNLVTLDLGGNNFSGKISESIDQLKKLEEFHLNNNNMSGELPSALSNCTHLITIDLKSNHFSGELTKVHFSNLPNLKTLDLYFNNFTGAIPGSIYSCSNLTALRLSANHFHGELSPRIGNLKYLSFLSLGKNNFTNITDALYILKNCRSLTTLLIGPNFRGELMPEDDIIDGFENLHVLDIGGCQLFGEIPLWISKLANLEVLILSDNQLTGSVPAWIKALSNVFYLKLSNNSLTGEIPTALMDMPMLKSDKTKSHLDPRIFELPVYTRLSRQYRKSIAFPKVMDLSNNKLTGEIPVEIGQLKSLLSLNLSFNGLTGQLPQSICNLTKLLALDLSNNNLQGAIPAALNSLHFLSTFNVSNNDLEGPIPSGGQFNTFETSSFNGNTRLCSSMLIHKCGSAEAPPATILSTKQTGYKDAFMIAFSAFFVVGVMYDQIVLSRYLA